MELWTLRLLTLLEQLGPEADYQSDITSIRSLA